MKTGVELITAERERQINQLGYAAPNDQGKTYELLDAAVAYIQQDVTWWPWHPALFNLTPEGRIRELTKAGALIAAEIDRLEYARSR